MQLFYDPEINGTEYQLSESESGHIVRVLRMQTGHPLAMVDGRGNWYRCEIADTHPKRCMVNVLEVKTIPRPKTDLHIAVAPTKQTDRIEWLLEKATEIGIRSITPVICTHSERKTVKPERLKRVLVAAMKQSLQAWLPELKPVTAFGDFVNEQNKGQRFIACCDDSDRISLKRAYRKGEEAIILIGPEGDFSKEEIEQAKRSGFRSVTLGRNRLRTETAALVAVHTVQFVNE